MTGVVSWDRQHAPSGLLYRPRYGVAMAGEVRLDSRGTTTLSDDDLVLEAYSRWGQRCCEHLQGDFAFVIWDPARRELFGARDQFGVQPLFYVDNGVRISIASSMDLLQAHGGGELDEVFLADLLLFDGAQDADRTVYRRMRRLPAAHTLTASCDGHARLRRYWTLPVEEPLQFRSGEDCVAEFNALLRTAVAERLTHPRVSVFFSGGLDSATLASHAGGVLGSGNVEAHTVIYRSLIADDEPHYAGAAAKALRVSVEFHEADNCPMYEDWDRQGICPVEPVHQPYGRSLWLNVQRRMSEHSPVALYGEGPDNALAYEWKPYLRQLVARRKWRLLGGECLRYPVLHRRLPAWRLINRRRASATPASTGELPAWLCPDFVRRLGLQDRWAHYQSTSSPVHPFRPKAYAALTSLTWPSLFESFHQGFSGVRLQVRHPYLDLRVVRFLLRVPVLAWARDKRLLREAARGILPEAVVQRPKTPLQGYPIQERIRRSGWPAIPRVAGLQGIVDFDRVPGATSGSPSQDWIHLRPVSLSHWLQQQQRFEHAGVQNNEHVQYATAAAR